ncbi:MAG: hypothetical protein AB7E85_08170, partial [Pseudobdellovibrionaceae bacterium]
MTVFKLFACLLSVSLLSFPAFAQEKDAPRYPYYIQQLAKSGAQVRYLGDDKGLQGWLVIINGQSQYIYNTPNEEAYVVGVLLDRKGEVITEKQLERMVQNVPPELQELMLDKAEIKDKAAAPVAKDSLSAKLMADMAEAPYLELGNENAPLVYAIIDPSCPHCHAFIRGLETSGALEAGRVRLHLIPAGVLSKDSLLQAATLLEKGPKEGGQILLAHIMGGKDDVLPIDPNVKLDQVRKNIVLMQK